MRVINFYKKSIFQAYKKPKNVEVYEETLNLPELGGRIRQISPCKCHQNYAANKLQGIKCVLMEHTMCSTGMSIFRKLQVTI